MSKLEKQGKKAGKKAKGKAKRREASAHAIETQGPAVTGDAGAARSRISPPALLAAAGAILLGAATAVLRHRR